jgi:prepilin-type processing-associated H-X9-DG protein
VYVDEAFWAGNKGRGCPEGPEIDQKALQAGGWGYPFGLLGEIHQHHYAGTPGLSTIYNGAYLINYYCITSGGWNQYIPENCYKPGRHKFPAETALLVEGSYYGSAGFLFSDWNNFTDFTLSAHVDYRHGFGDKINVAFFDGHAQTFTRKTIPVINGDAIAKSKFFYGTTDNLPLSSSQD